MNRQPRPADRPRTLSSLESLVVCGAVGVALFLLGAAGALPGNAMRYLLQIFLYITLGEAWNLLGGFAGLTSLGQQLYVGLAGYALAVVTTTLRLPFALGLLAGAAVCVAAAIPMALMLFRMHGMYFAVASWVAAEAVSLFFLSWKFVNQGGGMTIILSPYPSVGQIYLLALALCLAAIAAVTLLLRTRLGLGLMAMRDDPGAATAIGVDTRRCRFTAYLIAALLAGLAGGLFFLNKGTIYPESGFHISWTVSTVFVVIIGGSGTVGGPIVGAVIYVALNEYLAHYPGWSNIMLGAITLLVILFLPEGIVGTLQNRLNFECFSQRRFAEPAEPETPARERR